MTEENPRTYERYSYEAAVQYAYAGEEKYYDAKMYNYSNGGMYFETQYAVEPGAKMYIKMANYSPNASGPESYETYYGEARWCSEYSGPGAAYYGIGVQYEEPVSYGTY